MPNDIGLLILSIGIRLQMSVSVSKSKICRYSTSNVGIGFKK